MRASEDASRSRSPSIPPSHSDGNSAQHAASNGQLLLTNASPSPAAGKTLFLRASWLSVYKVKVHNTVHDCKQPKARQSTYIAGQLNILYENRSSQLFSHYRRLRNLQEAMPSGCQPHQACLEGRHLEEAASETLDNRKLRTLERRSPRSEL